ncbi:MAG: creatininase family protein [Spirulina sp. SIO3F2]|nr:creatininase family protein [Spirulina sp. SIO3F2]
MMHGFIPPNRFFAYLTWQEIEQMPDRANTVIIQPIGAVEQHGPHLPLIVDSAIATGVLGQALEQLDAAIPAYALPPLYYGKSNEHIHFSGTVTISATTLLSLIQEIAHSLYRAGFRKLVLLNGHGGQPQVLEIAARDLHQAQPDLLVFPLFVWKVPHSAAELLTPYELERGIHAGDAETSLLLSLLPGQVKMAQAVCEYPAQQSKAQTLLSLEGQLPFAWTTDELSQTGVIGDATVATKEKGDRLLNSLAQGWVQVLEEIYHFTQPQTKP